MIVPIFLLHMSQDHTAIVVLAAGKGKRMNADVPKVLVEIGGKPMIEHVLSAIEASEVDGKPVVVYGNGTEAVRDYVGDRAVSVLQAQQLGTAHALMAAREEILSRKGTTCVAVMNGDNPFISPETIQKVTEYHDQKPCPIIVAVGTVDSYEGWQSAFQSFGRIVRGEDKFIVAIREAKDASPEELDIREVNSAFYVFNHDWLWENIERVGNQNAQNEFYLTDMIQIAVDQGLPVRTFPIPIEECVGVNRLEEKEIAEMIAKKR